MEVRLYDLAADAVANAVDAGFEYVECPRCGWGGYWYKAGLDNFCPLCDEPLTKPVYDGAIVEAS